jgi:hypothetical protein
VGLFVQFADIFRQNLQGRLAGLGMEKFRPNHNREVFGTGQPLVDLDDLFELDDGNWFSSAHGINNVGQITGTVARDSGGRAFLLGPPGESDTEPPVLHLPEDIEVDATGPDGAVVEYVASATDDTDPNPTVDCQPASGSTFEIGTTTVECTATNANNMTAHGSFNVTVRGANHQLTDLEEYVRVLELNRGIERSLTVKLQHALNALDEGDIEAACEHLTDFQNQVRALSGKQITEAEANALLASSEQIKNVIGCS